MTGPRPMRGPGDGRVATASSAVGPAVTGVDPPCAVGRSVGTGRRSVRIARRQPVGALDRSADGRW